MSNKQFTFPSTEGGSEVVISEAGMEFLAQLSVEDVKRLNDTMEFVESVKLLSKVARWAVYGFLVTTGAVLSIWSSAKSIWPGGQH